MFALRRYHSKGQNSVTRLLHYWADVARAWGFQACDIPGPLSPNLSIPPAQTEFSVVTLQQGHTSCVCCPSRVQAFKVTRVDRADVKKYFPC